MDIEKYIREVPDFPQKGIKFKDITPLLADSNACKFATASLIRMVGDAPVDKVIGIESRGFFFAMLLANELNAGFVPVRKPNKLPYTKISEVYELEYGTDTLEMHSDAIKKGDRVLVHDDVLATGGTSRAVCNMVEKLGGQVVQCNFLIELSFLNGRNKLSGYEVRSLLQY